jgi:hypothetical protein
LPLLRQSAEREQSPSRCSRGEASLSGDDDEPIGDEDEPVPKVRKVVDPVFTSGIREKKSRLPP